jgi:hypothetical protein
VATTLLSLPLITATFVTGTNEDWLDSIFLHDGSELKRPVDLSGIEFRSQVRSDPDNALVVLDLSTRKGDRTLINGGALGLLGWKVPKARVRYINPDTYVFDVIGAADGHERRIVTGTVEFVRGVTR